jgi:tetratricopeptide (TPR) repeat protein
LPVDRARRHHNEIIRNIFWPRYHYRHHHRRIYTHIYSPRCYYPVRYYYGPRIIYRYIYPRYHRKYIFVSIGSYWPSSCFSIRYYRYGFHPYIWYGCYPVGYEIEGPTYNYYTYNYYGYEGDSSVTSYHSLTPVDETTFADVRARMTVKEPKPETMADKYFDRGVEAFENGDYQRAAMAFSYAMVLEPEDVILPFAYVQALFASEQYKRAAEALRTALEVLPPDQQGIFFPRGLYKDDDILLDQVEELGKKAAIFSYDSDLALLLGYQLLGIEEYDLARDWLEHSLMYNINRVSAEVLLKLLVKIEQFSE